MTRELAAEILSWKYDPPYDLYNNEVTESSINELVHEGYLAVEDETGALIGFYCNGHSAQVPTGRELGAYTEGAIDVGVGMHPELTGKGNGYVFFSFVLNELETLNSHSIFRLTVANFNKRAIKLYENLGFKKTYEFKTDTNEFIIMLKW
ncbi:GNAT family N-acetyltransferase [Mesobacillus boroniphilus]|uniref:GNAT family N-acetyltransferase n=2 Tax=Mesobacillus boroniphilus TaxID=308892 RepID=A0A944GW38_9BACI|nr:GNAT family N-acetyltransferase [Mesobacillus boroniphilus]